MEPDGRSTIRVCQGTGCLSAGSDKVCDSLNNKIGEHELEDQYAVDISGCHGFCSQGPLVTVEDLLYTGVEEKDVEWIVSRHLQGGEPVSSLLYRDPTTKERIANYTDIPYYSKQQRLLLDNCGKINPENIDDYIDIGGYSGLRTALQMQPQEVIDEIKASGLRGRGGAGFPTGSKWEFTRNAFSEDDRKFVIINADEGDPGAFMDRSLLEADPHAVIEGTIIGAYAIGATHGYIYVRAEYPLAVTRFQKALQQAREHNLLGDTILGSSFTFDIEI